MSNIIKISLVSGALVLLGACGDSDAERAATGMVIGGATAAVLGGDVATAALVGGAAGAVSCTVANNC